jgi:hypothetical protein
VSDVLTAVRVLPLLLKGVFLGLQNDAVVLCSVPEGRTQRDMAEEILNEGILSPSAIVQEMKTRFGVDASKSNVNQIKVNWKKAKGSSAPAAMRRRGPAKAKTAVAAKSGLITDNGAVASDTRNNGKITELEIAKFALKLGGVGPAIEALKKLLD